jgi:hypothetical protein
VRGSLINLGFYLQAKAAVLGETITRPTSLATLLQLSKEAWKTYPEAVAFTGFFAVFGVVIALMKDVPDVRGDVQYKIPSFSVKLGAAKMFRYVLSQCLSFYLSVSLRNVAQLSSQSTSPHADAPSTHTGLPGACSRAYCWLHPLVCCCTPAPSTPTSTAPPPSYQPQLPPSRP